MGNEVTGIYAPKQQPLHNAQVAAYAEHISNGAHVDTREVSQQDELDSWLQLFRDIKTKKQEIAKLEAMPGQENSAKLDRLYGGLISLEATKGAPPEQWRASESRAAGDTSPIQWDKGIESYKLLTARGANTTPPVPGGTAPLDPERRLAELRATGGTAKYKNSEWTFTGITKLVKSEKGRLRSDVKTIRSDLKEAAQAERDKNRPQFADGLGQR